MSEKEHPARTAGKYVRAAGVALKKERERLAAESAKKRAAEAAQAAQQTAQTATQAPVPPSTQAAAPPTAAATTKRPARQPAPPPPPNRFLDSLCWTLFLTALVASAIALLSIDTLFSGDTRTIVRFVLGGFFFVIAIALLTNWAHSKDRILLKLTKKLWGLDHPTTRTGRFMRAIAKDVLTLVGIAWLAIGAFEVLRVFA